MVRETVAPHFFRHSGVAVALVVALVAPAAGQLGGEVFLIPAEGYDSVAFDGYTLACEAGCLNPGGWRSISRAAEEDPVAVTNVLGPGALSFNEAGISGKNALSELSLSDTARIARGDRWSIGAPIDGTVQQALALLRSGALTMTVSGAGTDPGLRFVIVPEPTAWSLVAGVAALSWLTTRRRNHNSRT